MTAARVLLTVEEAVATVQKLVGDAPIGEITCEITRHGTVRITVKSDSRKPSAHEWKAR